jgi:hypothetical protein
MVICQLARDRAGRDTLFHEHFTEPLMIARDTQPQSVRIRVKRSHIVLLWLGPRFRVTNVQVTVVHRRGCSCVSSILLFQKISRTIRPYEQKHEVESIQSMTLWFEANEWFCWRTFVLA